MNDKSINAQGREEKRRMESHFLRSKVEVYVPGTIGIDTVTNTSEYADQTAKYLCEWFGGATRTVVEGYYITENGNSVVEPITIVWSYCETEQLTRYAVRVVNWASTMCRELKQESVAVVFNGQMLFVTGG